jgi:hypothetical protein
MGSPQGNAGAVRARAPRAGRSESVQKGTRESVASIHAAAVVNADWAKGLGCRSIAAHWIDYN